MESARSTVLPHDIAFGAFLAVSWIRYGVLLGPASSDSLICAALLLLDLVLIAWCARNPTPARWRARLAYYPLAISLAYAHLGGALGRIGAPLRDPLLLQLDTALFGTTPSLRLERWIHPVVTDVLSLGYLTYVPWLWLAMFLYWVGDLDVLKRFQAGLFSIYGIGFLGYSILPASGPYRSMAGMFHVPLVGDWLTEINSFAVSIGSNGVDVFPSLHCAGSLFLLAADRRFHRWRYRVLVLPSCVLWLSTIYLRYHYLVDCLAGFLLGAFGFWIDRHVQDRPRQGLPHRAEPGRFGHLVHRRPVSREVRSHRSDERIHEPPRLHRQERRQAARHAGLGLPRETGHRRPVRGDGANRQEAGCGRSALPPDSSPSRTLREWCFSTTGWPGERRTPQD